MSDQFPPKNFIPVPSAVEGIEVYAPAGGEKADYKKVVEFKCPQCGAETAYSIAEGGLTCTHCGYHQVSETQAVGRGAQEFEFTLETMEEAAHGWDQDRKELACQNCGAVTSVPPGDLTHTCPFCGSNQVVNRNTPGDVLRPRFLVPFQVDANQCRQAMKNWLGNSWMVPKSLGKVAGRTELTGMYIPYWTFDSVTNSNWRAQVGHTKTERYYSNGKWKTRTKIVWRWESGKVRMNIDDLLISGASRLSPLLIERVESYNLAQLTPYQPSYLAGFHARAYDITLETAWEQARRVMRERARTACRGQASTSRIRNFSMSMDFGDESWRYILLPLYIANYTYAGRNFQVYVNGQNAEVAGQRPVDWRKVWMVIALLLAPGLILSLLGLLTPLASRINFPIGVIGFGLVFITLIIAIFTLVQAQKLDDI
jgi:predicted RNA-binding Zn-ribbon protein involved in translation (DUF1610 family)